MPRAGKGPEKLFVLMLLPPSPPDEDDLLSSLLDAETDEEFDKLADIAFRGAGDTFVWRRFVEGALVSGSAKILRTAGYKSGKLVVRHPKVTQYEDGYLFTYSVTPANACQAAAEFLAKALKKAKPTLKIKVGFGPEE